MNTNTSDFQIRDAQAADMDAIAAIYNHYVDASTATLYTSAVTAEIMNGKYQAAQAKRYAFLVAEDDSGVIGFAYCNDFRPHGAYQLPECTIFLAPHACQRGVGRKIFGTLIEKMRQSGVPSVVSVITGGNVASGALHQQFGFKLAGVLKQVGKKFDRPVDIELWQLHF